MSEHYILVGHYPRSVALFEWAKWYESADEKRIVAKDYVGSILVSTVFLGLDHSFRNGPPLLFETMVFRGGSGEECERYSTWDEAVAGHAAMLAKVQGEPDPAA